MNTDEKRALSVFEVITKGWPILAAISCASMWVGTITAKTRQIDELITTMAEFKSELSQVKFEVREIRSIVEAHETNYRRNR